mgnify:CR=1 FL=1
MTMNDDGQVELWAVLVGNFPTRFSMPWTKRRAWRAGAFIISLDGFVGFYPIPPDGTLCLFRTKNDAIRGKNMMDSVGIITGSDIGPCSAYKEDLPKGCDDNDG